MVKVLFVCLGNICRSPLAEATFNNLVKQRGLQGNLWSDSAGTSTYHLGEQPDERTFEVAEKNGLTLNHLGRQINANDFKEFDYILAMDESNYRDILQFAKNKGIQLRKDQVLKLRRFENSNADLDVPDPYFGGMKGFDQVYGILNRSISGFLDYIEEHTLRDKGQ